MSRFFKSAAFPILIVVVLAFFAQKLFSPGPSTPKPNFPQFLQQVEGGQIKSADVKTKDNEVQVTLKNGQKYEVGYPDDYGNELINKLTASNVNFDVKVGIVVPRTVRIAPLPATLISIEPTWRGYMYFVYQDEIIVVEPNTLRIVAVLEV